MSNLKLLVKSPSHPVVLRQEVPHHTMADRMAAIPQEAVVLTVAQAAVTAAVHRAVTVAREAAITATHRVVTAADQATAMVAARAAIRAVRVITDQAIRAVPAITMAVLTIAMV